MRLPKFHTVAHRVGVVGLYRAGKTVFLTSLINHLQNHDPRVLPIADGQSRIIFRRQLPPENGFEEFPYFEHRDKLVYSRQWPVKTRATCQYRCQYYRSDWNLSRGELSLLDFPGERLADLPMAGCTYGQWSDFILTLFREHNEYRVYSQPYLDLLARPDASPEALINTYRRVLKDLFLNFRPVISPSTFILTDAGLWVGDLPPEQRFETNYVGLDRENQFLPLPREVRDRRPELAGAFASRYEVYRERIAVPLARWMQKCDELVVLVDVTTLLAGGLGMYEGNRELLRNLMTFLNPGQNLWGVSLSVIGRTLRMFRPLHDYVSEKWDLTWGGIRRIAFVATKADKVHASQRQHLQMLLKDMVEDLVGPYVEGSIRLDVDYFVCAAVNSTRSTADGRLQARFRSSDKTEVYTPSLVPTAWPHEDWSEMGLRYPNVAPWMPPRRDAPPDHLELNRVADYLLNG
ncbi:MAG TPA: YcjX family protein [Phycisphaerae bacterium]|jgi:predicted YcjX-like family ATPase|nr:YcjX family protein [Phycisphaerae bacterium]HOB75890.1 YcjX family protein [Phycisphaerae bacterium]HOJ54423.1 YcjX family protein [Phycisphaerae bacterium]HOL26262.1 YcjX family protein [Phycisphaerae bacterium]HPP20786.1 YcjX family protein [Phycisphaerae bacterium]